MKDLIIIGAGDFGREVTWIAERINQVSGTWNILGFVDDNATGVVDGYQVLGNTDWLCSYNKEVYVTCSIANGLIREFIWNKIQPNKNIYPATLIDPSVIVGRSVEIGQASIISAGTVLAISSKLRFNTIINLNCTIGHDTELMPYCTVHPGTNISGKVKIGEYCVIGTGTRIIQGLSVTSGVVLGAGSVVIKSLMESGTYAGVPVRKLEG